MKNPVNSGTLIEPLKPTNKQLFVKSFKNIEYSILKYSCFVLHDGFFDERVVLQLYNWLNVKSACWLGVVGMDDVLELGLLGLVDNCDMLEVGWVDIGLE